MTQTVHKYSSPILNYLKDQYGLTLSDVLLDIGSSCGHFLSIASMYTTVLGIEIDPTTFAGSVLSALKVMKAVEYESRIVPLFGDAVQDFENYLGAKYVYIFCYGFCPRNLKSVLSKVFQSESVQWLILGLSEGELEDFGFTAENLQCSITLKETIKNCPLVGSGEKKTLWIYKIDHRNKSTVTHLNPKFQHALKLLKFTNERKNYLHDYLASSAIQWLQRHERPRKKVKIFVSHQSF